MKNEKRIYAIIQARMNSIRYMDKVMKEIMGIPLLKILVERIKESKLLDINLKQYRMRLEALANSQS